MSQAKIVRFGTDAPPFEEGKPSGVIAGQPEDDLGLSVLAQGLLHSLRELVGVLVGHHQSQTIGAG